MTNSELKVELNKRFSSMKAENQLYTSSWKDIALYENPTRGQFNENKPTRGQMIDHKTLLDAYATGAIRKSASVLNSGITPKSRPWFRLMLADLDLSSYAPVRQWLDIVQKKMADVMIGSNIYGVFQNSYEELLTFGTSCFILLEDYWTAIRGRSFTAGEYLLGIDYRGRVDSFGRAFPMTVFQMVQQFGLESCSKQVQGHWKNNDKDKEFWIRHLIEPNTNRNMMMEDFMNMPFRSAYWELGDQNSDMFLGMRGFKRFPVIAPRWSVPTTDMIYGYGPGWDALGDVKELQKTKYDKLLAQEKLHNPPMQKDASIEGYVNLFPGGVSTSTNNVPNAGLRPSYQINPNLESFIELIDQVKKSIDRHFYIDVFIMLAQLERNQITAQEIMAREQERTMVMGSILNTIDEEKLSVVIEWVFGTLYDAGAFPPPPEEIEGMDIHVQYISIMAQAQRALGISDIERVIGFVGANAQIAPQMLDVINWDEAVREIADMQGIPAKLVNDPVMVQGVREDRQAQQNNMIALEAANSAADTTKKLSEAEMDKGSALDGIMKGYKT
jgi:hypothetical protein